VRALPLFVLLPLIAAACGAPPPPSPLPERAPNIVILYADDLGYGDLGCYDRRSKIPTPHLDRLASQGLLCRDAHSSSGICTPSRYALLTGRHHWRKFHEIVNSFGPSVFDDARLTLPEMLQQRGYRTACIGKWHLGWDWQAIKKPGALPEKGMGYAADAFDWSRPIPDGPLAHGFDHYFGDDVPNFPPYAWIEDDRVVVAPSVPYRPDPLPREGHHEGRPGPMVDGWRLDAVMPELTRRAVDYVHAQRGGEQPFFLYFPFTAPHAPIVPSAEFVGVSEAGPYGDYVAQCDATVGAVLQALDDAGVADETLVVFTSDNGPEAYAYERIRNHGHRSAGDLRGVKRDVWEGGHRVPFLVRWPGVVAAGRVSDDLVSQCDLMATIARAVGFELPDDAAEDSFDQTPLLVGSGATVRNVLVHNTYQNRWALRFDRYVYIAASDGTHNRLPDWVAAQYEEPAGYTLWFDLEVDVGQRHELETGVGGLHELLEDIIRRGHSAPRLQKERE